MREGRSLTNLPYNPNPHDTAMTNSVFVLWTSDQWLSTDKKSLLAVCESEEKAKELALEYAKSELDIISINDEEELPEWDELEARGMSEKEIEDFYAEQDRKLEDKTHLEDIISDLNNNRQWTGDDCGIYYEEMELNELQ